MMQAVFVLLVSLVVFSNGHGWVVSPEPRGFQGDSEASASTANACGRGGNYGQVTTVTAGESVEVSFKTGGGHTGVTCQFAISLSEDAGTFTSVGNVVDPCPASTDYTETVTIPANQPAGTAYLQWTWTETGNTWYSCMQLNILPNDVETVTLEQDDEHSLECSSEPVYYQINLKDAESKDQNVHFTITNDGDEPIMASVDVGAIPSNFNNSRYPLYVDAGESESVTVCIGNQATENAFVTVFPCQGEYKVTATVYKALLSVVEATARNIAYDNEATFFFFSQSTSTTSKARRMIYTGVGSPDCYFSGSYRTCMNYETPAASEISRCVDLPLDGGNQDHGINYYALECSSAIDGLVSVESGNCRDWEEPEAPPPADSVAVVAVSTLAFAMALF